MNGKEKYTAEQTDEFVRYILIFVTKLKMWVGQIWLEGVFVFKSSMTKSNSNGPTELLEDS